MKLYRIHSPRGGSDIEIRTDDLLSAVAGMLVYYTKDGAVYDGAFTPKRIEERPGILGGKGGLVVVGHAGWSPTSGSPCEIWVHYPEQCSTAPTPLEEIQSLRAAMDRILGCFDVNTIHEIVLSHLKSLE